MRTSDENSVSQRPNPRPGDVVEVHWCGRWQPAEVMPPNADTVERFPHICGVPGTIFAWPQSLGEPGPAIGALLFPADDWRWPPLSDRLAVLLSNVVTPLPCTAVQHEIIGSARRIFRAFTTPIGSQEDGRGGWLELANCQRCGSTLSHWRVDEPTGPQCLQCMNALDGCRCEVRR